MHAGISVSHFKRITFWTTQLLIKPESKLTQKNQYLQRSSNYHSQKTDTAETIIESDKRINKLELDGRTSVL